MDNELVFYHNLKDEPYTTISVIEKFTKNSRHSIMQLINRHKNKLEELGVLAFEMRKPLKGSKGGRPIKEIHLNEDQATFLIKLQIIRPRLLISSLLLLLHSDKQNKN